MDVPLSPGRNKGVAVNKRVRSAASMPPSPHGKSGQLGCGTGQPASAPKSQEKAIPFKSGERNPAPLWPRHHQ